MKVSPTFLTVLALVFLGGFAVLTDALYRIQVQQTADFKKNFADQTTRRVRVPGRRGRIVDCRGNILAETRAAHDLVCRPEAFPGHATTDAIDRALDDFTALTGIPRTVNRDRIARHLREESARPLVVARDVDARALARFEERADAFPAFETVTRPERTYPFHRLATHVLGYVGRERPDAADATGIHYYESDMRGRSGLEFFYDSYLTGAAGDVRLVVNARGFTVNAVTERAAVPGLDLAITLDARIQRTVERELAGVAGACVALDPRTGAVLALASAPAYDANLFVPGITRAAYRALAEDPLHPLLNRAVAGRFAPGSTFKPITALAALACGWNAADALDCTGIYRETRCTARWGHGPLALREALEKSCNPFFLQLGQFAGGENVLDVARGAGLGQRTGIDLPGEAAGQLEPWHFQSAMGQGPLLVTPLQMAVVCAAIGNGGAVYRPYLHQSESGVPPPVSDLGAEREHLEIVRLGMRDVVLNGSAAKAFHPRRDGRRYALAVSAAGKTGSAEVGSRENRWKNTWFMAFAPYEAPTFAIAMIVEHGEFGGSTVAPRVYRVLASLFGEREVEG